MSYKKLKLTQVQDEVFRCEDQYDNVPYDLHSRLSHHCSGHVCAVDSDDATPARHYCSLYVE